MSYTKVQINVLYQGLMQRCQLMSDTNKPPNVIAMLRTYVLYQGETNQIYNKEINIS